MKDGDQISLIRFIPPEARRVLEISEQPSKLAEISAERSPNAKIFWSVPGGVVPAGPLDCIVVFDSPSPQEGHDTISLALELLADGGQVIAAGGLVSEDQLGAADCSVFERAGHIRAVKRGPKVRPVLLHCSIPVANENHADIRIHRPNAFLRTIPGLRPISQIEYINNGIAEANEAKILLLHRSIMREERDMGFLRSVLDQNYLIVQEIDDDPRHFEDSYTKDDRFALRCAHAAQTSRQPVADFLGETLDDVAIFANQMAFLPALREPIKRKAVRVFFGAFNREPDRDESLGAINRVIERSNRPIEFEVIHDRGFFDGLKTDRKRFTIRMNYELYLDILRRADIALLPLLDTQFNRCKSDLKFIESAAHGVVAIASPTVYAETVRDGETGVLYRSPEEFEERFTRLVAEEARRLAIREAAWAYVRDERMLADHYRARHDWYLNLIDRADELRAAHRARMPEIYG